jgi:hypothetical protein
MADLYRRKVEQLEAAPNEPSIPQEASGILRWMVERIRLAPDANAADGIRVEVEGDLAAILAAASGRGRIPIGIGGSLAAPPLPHHRTCGSAYGGSVD